MLVPAATFAQSAAWRLPPSAAAARAADDAQVSYYDARRTAYDRGYREGADDGQQDARRGDRFNYRDERAFQRADRGYHRSYGDRDRYRQIFRDGYAVGYREAFGRFSRNGRNDGWYSQNPGPRGPYGQQAPYPSRNGGYYTPAFDNGARDGYEKGQEDARKRRAFDPHRHSWYRSGDRHYENRYGSREQYKDLYRRAFQQGYERGFREGRW
jgi:flagellar biosynthesis/type III secretory pathway protein FliH